MPNKDGAWLLDQHLTVAMEYLKFGFNLKADEISYVEPTCSKIFFEVAHEADLADLVELQAIEACFIFALLKHLYFCSCRSAFVAFIYIDNDSAHPAGHSSQQT
jgi:hypothetical protein